MRNPWSYKHGGYMGRKATPEYAAFRNARTRCNNPKAPNYAYYGARGIEFRFNSFQQFFEELGPRPSKDHSIERINNDGHYEPGNVRWATRIEQHNNVRTNRRITINGQTQTLAEWIRQSDLHESTIMYRLRLGWCDRCVFTLPARPGRKQQCLCLKDFGENG